MYIYSTSHGEKIFHAASCTYSGRIKMKNRNYFDTKQEAREHGYRMCNCCAPIVRYMKRERNEIECFARKHNMKLHVYDGELHVEFGVVPWKIVVEDETREIILYHGNRERYNTLEWKHGMLQHHYHRQNDVSKGTILEYLDYIYKHDCWRSNQIEEYRKLPKQTRNQRKRYKKEKNKADRYAVSRVLNLIDRMQRERMAE